MAKIRERIWTGADGVKRRAWQADFVDQAGKRRCRQFARRKDADNFLVAARNQVARGTYSPDSNSITIGEAADFWLVRCVNEQLEASTLNQYRGHVANHIKPLIGRLRLSRLTAPMVEQFLDQMLASGRSRMLIRAVLVSVKALIAEAQRRGLVMQNVAAGARVKLAKRHSAKVVIPSKAEIKELLEAAPPRWRPLLIVAIFAGLRASELRGLRWSDVDFGHKLLMVRQRADTTGKLGSLKSAASRRDVPMSPMVLHALKEWRLACPKGPLDLVFPGRNAGIPSHNTLRDALGPLHRYRHFFASWLIDRGFGPKRVQALMGHSSITVTFDVYGHLFPAEDDHDRFAAGELAVVGEASAARLRHGATDHR
jgi:integrase